MLNQEYMNDRKKEVSNTLMNETLEKTIIEKIKS